MEFLMSFVLKGIGVTATTFWLSIAISTLILLFLSVLYQKMR